MTMASAENTDLGLMAKEFDGVLKRYGRAKYDGRLGYYRPDCVLTLSEFVTFRTKREAGKFATGNGYTAQHVERIGSRFWSAWGIRHDHRDSYFLANYE